MIKNTIKFNQAFFADLHEKHKLYPHQAEFAKQLFRENKKFLSARWGRKAGKSETGLYCLIRAANTKDNSALYWFAPKAKQAREIIWASGRLQNYVPKRYIKKIKESETRVIFWNNSFIKLDGSDEYEQYRGVECDGALYDESKDFHPLFDAGFRPNLGPRNGFLLNFGTPPRNIISPSEKQFFAFEEEAKSRSDGFYSICPSWARTDPVWLNTLKQIYSEYERRYKAGDLDALNVWKCEYGAEYIQGGPGSIFPMVTKERHGQPRNQILQHLQHHAHHCDFFCIADPATTSTFAILFAFIDTKTAHIYVPYTIYENDQHENVIGRIYPRITNIINLIYPYPSLWSYIYDEAESWFKMHILSSYDDPGWRPTNKHAYRRSSSSEVKPYLQKVKDAFSFNHITIALEEEPLWDELLSYKIDQHGNIPKIKDHLLDCLRYLLAESQFSFITQQEEEDSRTLKPPRQYSITPASLLDNDSSLDIQSTLPDISLEDIYDPNYNSL